MDLSFDGFGINGEDKHRTRLATFTGGATDETVQLLGPLLAAAPKLLAAAEHFDECTYFQDNDGLECPLCIKHRRAINEAKGGA